MIHAVTGRTGEGKSCYAVRYIILPELLKTNRPVVTNIALDVEEVQKYIEEKGGRFDREQLVLWPFETPEKGVTQYVRYWDKEGEKEAVFNPHEFWKTAPFGALIVFDEAGEFLNALDLSANKQSQLLGSFGRTHRHQKFDVYFLLQDLSDMAAAMRKLVQKHVTVYSFYQHPLGGLIKMAVFMIRKFDIGGMKNAKSEMPEFRAYKKRIFELYNSFQHANAHETLDYEVELEPKPPLKESVFGKVRDYVLGQPIFAIIAVAAIFIVFSMYRIAGVAKFPEKQERAKDGTITDKITAKVLPAAAPREATTDSDSGVFGAEAPSGRKSNRYSSLRVRGYGVNANGK